MNRKSTSKRGAVVKEGYVELEIAFTAEEDATLRKTAAAHTISVPELIRRNFIEEVRRNSLKKTLMTDVSLKLEKLKNIANNVDTMSPIDFAEALLEVLNPLEGLIAGTDIHQEPKQLQ